MCNVVDGLFYPAALRARRNASIFKSKLQKLWNIWNCCDFESSLVKDWMFLQKWQKLNERNYFSFKASGIFKWVNQTSF